MEENLKLVEHPAQRGRALSTHRLLWWLAADLVVMAGIVVWYLAAAYNQSAVDFTPPGITASADSSDVSVVEYGTEVNVK